MKNSYLLSVLSNKCPRCRKGNIFASDNAYKLSETTKMKESCEVCGQPTEIEVGFYYGTGYVSYALSVAFSVATFIAWWVLIGFSLDDTRFFWWMGTNAVLMIVLQPLFMRLSRSIWLSWFVKYDKDWKIHTLESFERVVPNQEG
jgi:phage FluMu protein Com